MALQWENTASDTAVVIPHNLMTFLNFALKSSFKDQILSQELVQVEYLSSKSILLSTNTNYLQVFTAQNLFHVESVFASN